MFNHARELEVLRESLESLHRKIDTMSQIADQITLAASAITTAVATLTANGLPDPTLAPAVAHLEIAVSALAALVPPSAPSATP